MQTQNTGDFLQHFVCVFQAASPACTELETVMLDWLGKMVKLPECFLAGTTGHGGGVIQVISEHSKLLNLIW